MTASPRLHPQVYRLHRPFAGDTSITSQPNRVEVGDRLERREVLAVSQAGESLKSYESRKSKRFLSYVAIW
jgi:hypothetical protein